MSHQHYATGSLLLTLPSVGRVLNRFAKDVGFLDDLLPITFCEYLLVSGLQRGAGYLVDMHTVIRLIPRPEPNLLPMLPIFFLLAILINSTYRMAGKFGGEFNLAVWRIMNAPPN